MHAAIALAALLAAAPSAQKGGPTSAAELSRLTLPESNWDQVVAMGKDQARQGMAQALDASLKQSGATLPAGLGERLNAEMDRFMVDFMPGYQEMVDFQAGLLQKHFSEAELKQLLVLYRSPLGKKLIQVQPQIAADVMAWTQDRMQKKFPAMMEGMTATVRDFYEAQQHGAEGEGEAGAEAPAAAEATPEAK